MAELLLLEATKYWFLAHPEKSVHRHILDISTKILGVVLIVLGVIGAFIPIVSFFTLAIIGLGPLGVKPEFIEKIKLRVREFIARKPRV
jgi:hypothetical protein